MASVYLVVLCGLLAVSFVRGKPFPLGFHVFKCVFQTNEKFQRQPEMFRENTLLRLPFPLRSLRSMCTANTIQNLFRKPESNSGVFILMFQVMRKMKTS